MKNILFVVFISMIFLFVCCNTTTNKNIIETEISDFDKILDSFQVNGSILIYDNVEKPLYFDPFGQTEFTHLGHNMIDPLKSWC